MDQVRAGDRAVEHFQPQRNYNLKSNFNRSELPPTRTEVFKGSETGQPMLVPGSAHLFRDAIARYQGIVERGGWPTVPVDSRIVPGTSSPVIALLRQRLAAEGYLPHGGGDQFDHDVVDAVRQFQIRHGLKPDGKVGRETLMTMAVSAVARLETLRANLPRVEEYAKNLGTRYIVVNIPAAQLDAVAYGRMYSRHNVIVGQTDRPSPVLNSAVHELNFNPYWNAPVSIVRKDIIPKLLKNPRFLDTMNIKVFLGVGGPEIDPSTVDWTTADPAKYHFRQEPGADNAMATVKINFPNKYAVYMHDTPTKQLFSQSARYFSSGCVRVERVGVLVNWILNGQEGWNPDRVNAVGKSGDRLDVKVQQKPQLRFAYLTAWVAADGSVHFRRDIYKLDGTGFVVGQPLALSSG